MSLVLDCSVNLSWYFEDERTAASLAVLQQVVEQCGVAPSLWRFEVANGLQMAIRRKRIDAVYRAASLIDLAAYRLRSTLTVIATSGLRPSSSLNSMASRSTMPPISSWRSAGAYLSPLSTAPCVKQRRR